VFSELLVFLGVDGAGLDIWAICIKVVSVAALETLASLLVLLSVVDVDAV
jgi:hypothetical protein